MRNNGKTSAIDCGGYRSSSTRFFFLWLGPWLLMTGTWFNLKGELRNRDGGDGGGTRVTAKLGFEGELAWGCMGEMHLSLYRGVGGVRKD
jgi:hypothetical protein